MKTAILITVLIIFVFGVFLFNQFFFSGEEKVVSTSQYVFPYDLSNPTKTYKLKGVLKEISGLSWYDDHEIACVQDEDGLVFIYDLKKDKIEEEIKFAKDGDYEGIEYVGKTTWVVKRNGDLFQVKKFDTKKQETKKHETFLNSNNDVEGLAYDADNNRLLLACKGKAGEGKKFKNKRAIYEFNLDKKKLKKTPAYLVDLDDIRKFVEAGRVAGYYEKVAEFFDPNNGNITFQPSSLAVHPISNEIFVISSIGKLLLVLNPRGKIVYLHKLDKTKFKQPEGITFDKRGNLYISTEGKGGKGKIFEFGFD